MSSQETNVTFCGATIESTRSKEDPIPTPEDFGRLFEIQEQFFKRQKSSISASDIQETTAQCLLLQAAGGGLTDFIEEYCEK